VTSAGSSGSAEHHCECSDVISGGMHQVRVVGLPRTAPSALDRLRSACGGVEGSDPRGLPGQPPGAHRSAFESTPMTLASSSERSRLCWNLVASILADRPIPPLLALPAAPLRRSTPVASTPGAAPIARRLAFGSGFPGPDVVFRPHGLSPPRRFSPQQACGFVAPRCRP